MSVNLVFTPFHKNTSPNNLIRLAKSDQSQVSIFLITTAKVDTAHNYDVISAKFKSVGSAIKVRSVNQDFQVNNYGANSATTAPRQESLDQLEDILQESSTEEEEIPQLPQQHTSSLSEVELEQDLININLAALEDAVADIEQYLEEKTKTK